MSESEESSAPAVGRRLHRRVCVVAPRRDVARPEGHGAVAKSVGVSGSPPKGGEALAEDRPPARHVRQQRRAVGARHLCAGASADGARDEAPEPATALVHAEVRRRDGYVVDRNQAEEGFKVKGAGEVACDRAAHRVADQRDVAQARMRSHNASQLVEHPACADLDAVQRRQQRVALGRDHERIRYGRANRGGDSCDVPTRAHVAVQRDEEMCWRQRSWRVLLNHGPQAIHIGAADRGHLLLIHEGQKRRHGGYALLLRQLLCFIHVHLEEDHVLELLCKCRVRRRRSLARAAPARGEIDDDRSALGGRLGQHRLELGRADDRPWRQGGASHVHRCAAMLLPPRPCERYLTWRPTLACGAITRMGGDPPLFSSKELPSLTAGFMGCCIWSDARPTT